MTTRQVRTASAQILQSFSHQKQSGQLAITRAMIALTHQLINELKQSVQEDDAASRRRKAKRRETELDPKPPVKPVRVAEPSKPRKPKYSGL